MECIPVHQPEVSGACALVLPDVEATHLCAEAGDVDHVDHRCRCGASWTARRTARASGST